MFDRRSAIQAMAVSCLVGFERPAAAEPGEEDEFLVPMDNISIDDLNKIHPFGSHPASREEIKHAENIIANTPSGPRPVDIAQSFYDRFYKDDPHAISEWPRNESWNPLIAKFFESTTLHTKQDTVAWCAAFVNWCLERSHRPATKNSASQSFVTTNKFKVTNSPTEGDIAVFTCYKMGTTSSLGIGHVTFFKRFVDDHHFVALGGNQSGKTPSIICEKTFPTAFASHRTVSGSRVPVDYKINRFLHIV